MKSCLFAAVLSVVIVCAAPGAESNFTSVVSPEDYSAAGLNQLTPDQIARLNALVERYKSGELAAAQQAAEEAVAAKQAAELVAQRAEEKARDAETAAAKAELERANAPAANPGKNFLAKAKGFFKASDDKAEAVVESTIPGPFQGWSPKQVFVLANGTRWQVANADYYYTPRMQNPRVLVLPAALTGYWLRFPELKTQVRVKFLSDK